MLSTAEPIKTKKNDVKVINLKKGLIFYHLKWFALYVAILSFILLSVLHLGIRIITQDFIFHNAIEATVKKQIFQTKLKAVEVKQGHRKRTGVQ